MIIFTQGVSVPELCGHHGVSVLLAVLHPAPVPHLAARHLQRDPPQRDGRVRVSGGAAHLAPLHAPHGSLPRHQRHPL